MTELQSLADFIAEHRITITSEAVDNNPNMPDPYMDHWKVRLRNKYGR